MKTKIGYEIKYAFQKMTTQIVINKTHGGFHLTDEAIATYAHRKMKVIIKIGKSHYFDGIKDSDHHFNPRCIPRDDPDLIQTVLILNTRFSTKLPNLKIVEIPSDVNWVIEDYDGVEWVAEVHRRWD